MSGNEEGPGLSSVTWCCSRLNLPEPSCRRGAMLTALTTERGCFGDPFCTDYNMPHMGEVFLMLAWPLFNIVT